MAATPKQIEELKAALLPVPPATPFSHVVGSGTDGFMPLSVAEVTQQENDEADWRMELAKPKAPTLEERLAALEAALKAKG